MRDMNQRTVRIKTISQENWVLINKIDEIKGQWMGGVQLNPQLLGRLKRSVLLTSSGASTRIEGAQLSDEDIEKLLQGLALKKFRDRDKQEVRGYYELLATIFDAWKKIPITESSIKHLHAELLKYVPKDDRHRGEYKKVENSVDMFDAHGVSVGVVFKTTSAFQTPMQMEQLVTWTRDAIDRAVTHPLVLIANFIVEFLAIHPFQDGNGRLSRILTNLMMLQAGYAYTPYVSHEKLVEAHKADYYIALRRSQKTFNTAHHDISAWLEFFLKISLAHAVGARELLSQENIEKILSVKQLAVWRHLAGVEHATPAEICQATAVSRPTVSQAVSVLLRLKRIERIGQGRTTRYKRI